MGPLTYPHGNWEPPKQREKVLEANSEYQQRAVLPCGVRLCLGRGPPPANVSTEPKRIRTQGCLSFAS
uniref:Uncharacterized protein n=1 Tax=Colobus angolensis palliatus TaxID=336983 RepID=A0A2K5K5L3_COLAP